MFYSELLLIECSEAELGEGTGKLLQWHRVTGRGFGAGLTRPLTYKPNEFRRGGRRC